MLDSQTARRGLFDHSHTLSSRPEAALFAAEVERPAACLHQHYCLRGQPAGLDAKRATNICIALCNLQVSPLRMTIKPSCFGRDDRFDVIRPHITPPMKQL